MTEYSFIPVSVWKPQRLPALMQASRLLHKALSVLWFALFTRSRPLHNSFFNKLTGLLS